MQAGSGVISISARYVDALQNAAHLRVTNLAEIWLGGARIASFSVEATSTLTVDRNNVVRRSASLALSDGVAYADDGSNVPVVPTTPQDVFLPYGAEIALYSGLVYDDGTQELVQLLVGGIEDVVIDDSDADLVVTLAAYDRMKQVQRAGCIDAYTIPPSQNMVTAMANLLNYAFAGAANVPWDSTAFTSTPHVTPKTATVYKPGDDIAQKLAELADSIGYEVFFDPSGVPVLMPVPDPNNATPDWTYDETQLTNLAEAWRRTISRQNAPNYIIRTGQGTGVGPPITGIAKDTNPNSPTFIGGDYGRQLDAQSSPLINTQAQANDAANAALLKALGTIEGLEFKAVPKPDHDVDDVVLQNRARVGVASQLYVLDSFTLGFGSGGLLDATARQIGSIP